MYSQGCGGSSPFFGTKETDSTSTFFGSCLRTQSPGIFHKTFEEFQRTTTSVLPLTVCSEDFLKLELAEPFRTFTDEELINYSVRDGEMNFPPGTSQQYSHTDNVILGQVIQRATNESMKELYEKNIFGPLGMKDTQFPINQEIQRPVLHAFTKDRGFYEDCTYWNPFWGSTPGLPTSNLHDVGKWGPILGTGRLISPEHFQEQIAPASVGKGKNRPDLYFAYGFVVANGWIVQNPSINGYSGAFGYNLATGVTIRGRGHQERDRHHRRVRLRHFPPGRQLRHPKLAD